MNATEAAANLLNMSTQVKAFVLVYVTGDGIPKFFGDGNPVEKVGLLGLAMLILDNHISTILKEIAPGDLGGST